MMENWRYSKAASGIWTFGATLESGRMTVISAVAGLPVTFGEAEVGSVAGGFLHLQELEGALAVATASAGVTACRNWPSVPAAVSLNVRAVTMSGTAVAVVTWSAP